MTHALNTFVLLITIPTRKITDFKLVLFSCRLLLHVTADLVRFYIILNLRKFERLWMLNSLKQNCKSGQNHEFIPFPNRLFLPSLFILTQILSTVSLIKGCAKTWTKLSPKRQPLLNVLYGSCVLSAYRIDLVLYQKSAFDHKNAATFNRVLRINVKAHLLNSSFFVTLPLT